MDTKIAKIIFCLALVVFNTRCSSDSKKEIKDSPAVMLIQLDTGSPADTNDIKVKRAQFLLSQLATIWKTPIDTIAEYTFKGKQVITSKGLEETNLNILEQQFIMVSGNEHITENSKFSDAMVLYTMVRQ